MFSSFSSSTWISETTRFEDFGGISVVSNCLSCLFLLAVALTSEVVMIDVFVAR